MTIVHFLITQVDLSTSWRKTANEWQHCLRKEQNDYLFFSTEETSSLRVVVNTSRGNTEEIIGFLKGGSPRRLLTHFVICLNSKSELTAGPSDFSMELSSPSIPALMNHSDSWLPPGISSTTLSLWKGAECCSRSRAAFSLGHRRTRNTECHSRAFQISFQLLKEYSMQVRFSSIQVKLDSN